MKKPTIEDLVKLATDAGLRVDLALTPIPPQPKQTKSEVREIIARLRKSPGQPDTNDVLAVCEVLEIICGK